MVHSHFFLLQKVFPKGLKITSNSLDSAWNSGNYMNGSKWTPNYFLQSHSSVIFLNLQCKISAITFMQFVRFIHLASLLKRSHKPCIAFLFPTSFLKQSHLVYSEVPYVHTLVYAPCLDSLDKYWSELFTLWMYHLFWSGCSFWRKHQSNLYNC